MIDMNSKFIKTSLFILILNSYHVIIVLIENVEMSVFVRATFSVEVCFPGAAEIHKFSLKLGLGSFVMLISFVMYVW